MGEATHLVCVCWGGWVRQTLLDSQGLQFEGRLKVGVAEGQRTLHAGTGFINGVGV
jgi:hypothetical protein